MGAALAASEGGLVRLGDSLCSPVPGNLGLLRLPVRARLCRHASMDGGRYVFKMVQTSVHICTFARNFSTVKSCMMQD